MNPVTLADRKQELRILLDQIESQPSHDWTQARERVRILQDMIATEARKAADQQADA
jgi:hypothetical protein